MKIRISSFNLILSVLGFLFVFMLFWPQNFCFADTCRTCNGSGRVTCTRCGGSGGIDPVNCGGATGLHGCPDCGGTYGNPCSGGSSQGSGRVTCPTCGGSGSVSSSSSSGQSSSSQAEAARQKAFEEQQKRDQEAAQRKQEEFEKSKQEALKSMKGITENELGLKGTDTGNDLGLKGVGDTSELGLKDNLNTGNQGKRSAQALKEQADFEKMNAAWMKSQKTLIQQRLQRPNKWCSSIYRSLKIKEPPLPYKRFDELQAGDVLLISPAEGHDWDARKSQSIQIADRLSSWEWESPASHTLIYLKEVNGIKYFLDSQSEEGPRIKTGEEIINEYSHREVHVAEPGNYEVAQPLLKEEAKKLWDAAMEIRAKELAAEDKKRNNLIDKTNYGLFGDDNMVCSETSRWALIRAGRNIPDSGSPFKKLLGVYFGPTNFYHNEQYFLVSPMKWPGKKKYPQP